MYLCMFVRACEHVYVCVRICMYICMLVCIYVLCMFVCMCGFCVVVLFVFVVKIQTLKKTQM